MGIQFGSLAPAVRKGLASRQEPLTIMSRVRSTIKHTVAVEGVGLHSGIQTRLELRPADPGTGLVFVRSDLRNLRIEAHQSATTALDYATSVGRDDVSVGTVEHLLSAVVATGVTDMEMVIDGSEVPILDGSALPFLHLIEAACPQKSGSPVEPIRLREPIEVRHRDRWIVIEPSDRLEIEYAIEFDHPSIGNQQINLTIDEETFGSEVAPARTFGFLRDVERMRAAGLARGGSLENCIVLDDSGIASGQLRFEDEFVRHKVLDLVGDLALLGRPILGRISAWKAGHALHSHLVQAILSNTQAWIETDGQSLARAASLPARVS